MILEECKCLTPTERSALINAFSFAESYIKDDLRKHEHDKESAAYRMMNANLIELEDIKSKVNKTPECSIFQLSSQLLRHIRKKYRKKD